MRNQSSDALIAAAQLDPISREAVAVPTFSDLPGIWITQMVVVGINSVGCWSQLLPQHSPAAGRPCARCQRSKVEMIADLARQRTQLELLGLEKRERLISERLHDGAPISVRPGSTPKTWRSAGTLKLWQTGARRVLGPAARCAVRELHADMLDIRQYPPPTDRLFPSRGGAWSTTVTWPDSLRTKAIACAAARAREALTNVIDLHRPTPIELEHHEELASLRVSEDEQGWASHIAQKLEGHIGMAPRYSHPGTVGACARHTPELKSPLSIPGLRPAGVGELLGWLDRRKRVEQLNQTVSVKIAALATVHARPPAGDFEGDSRPPTLVSKTIRDLFLGRVRRAASTPDKQIRTRQQPRCATNQCAFEYRTCAAWHDSHSWPTMDHSPAYVPGTALTSETSSEPRTELHWTGAGGVSTSFESRVPPEPGY